MLRQVLPTWLWNRLKQLQRMLVSVQQKCLTLASRRFARRNPVAFRRALEAAGYQVARDEDYYFSLPSVARLRENVARWNRPSALHGVEYDLAAMKSALAELLARYFDEFLTFPPELWIFGQDWPMFWDQPMVVQSFLTFNKNFKISLSTCLIRYFDEPFLNQNIPIYESVAQGLNTFSSIWLRRIS